jgi:light-regulated signal transduction histidine kinase (bacteriophytochrome)/CheY-like chemotaxis protein
VAALCRTLQGQGYATTGFVSSAQALQQLREGAFDIVITDLMMPELDGIALLRAAHEIDPDLIGIVMTGRGTIDTAVEAMKSGALDYILKPFKLSSMLPVLSRALAVRRLRLDKTALEKQLNERTAALEIANRELDAFARSASHDLRTPATRIIGFAELLLQENAGPLNANQKEFLGHMLEACQRQVRLIDGLLRLARLGHQPLAKLRVNVGDLVRELLRELSALEPQRKIALEVGPLADAWADPLLLRQLFENLFANAFKFTRRTENAGIEVFGQQHDGESIYVVRDNGAGFDMQFADRLFTIAERLHGDDEFEGTGIGLSIVQRIIERHGGRISAQGEVDKGACFTVALPYQASDGL